MVCRVTLPCVMALLAMLDITLAMEQSAAGTITGHGRPPPGDGSPSPGNCGGTGWASPGWNASLFGCQRAACGAIHASANGIRSLADCVAACRGCAACSYVSFQQGASGSLGNSENHDDCSWYTHCPETSAAGSMSGYHSAYVKAGTSSEPGIGSCSVHVPSPPPAPPHRSHYDVSVSIDWSSSAQLGTTSAAATVEVLSEHTASVDLSASACF